MAKSEKSKSKNGINRFWRCLIPFGSKRHSGREYTYLSSHRPSVVKSILRTVTLGYWDKERLDFSSLCFVCIYLRGYVPDNRGERLRSLRERCALGTCPHVWPPSRLLVPGLRRLPSTQSELESTRYSGPSSAGVIHSNCSSPAAKGAVLGVRATVSVTVIAEIPDPQSGAQTVGLHRQAPAS